MNLHTGIIFKIYSNLLSILQDPNITGLDLYDALKDGLKGYIGDKNMFFEPVKRGILYVISKFSFEDCIMQSHLDNDSVGFYIKSSEHLLWYFEEFLEFLRFHNFEIPKDIENEFDRIVTTSECLFEESFNNIEKEYEYYDYLDYKNRTMRRMLDILKEKNRKNIEQISEDYIIAVAARVFHDRELCAWISDLLIQIGFPGEYKQWVERPRSWPKWVQADLFTREGGRCALCGADFAEDPSIIAHIDHIIPISKGGCNDIVNLQLLCERCNTSKKQEMLPVKPSIPNYLKRRIKGKEKKRV